MRNRTMRSDGMGRDQDSQRRRRHGGERDGDETVGDRKRKRRERGRQESSRGQHGGRHGRRGGGRGRAKRGEARIILLDVLRDGPKHGYEMIKTLEERSGGQYVPSPGTVYPTLQYLEDQGLVRAEQEAERRVYQLTEAGTAELETQTAALAEFWSQFEPQPATAAGQPEIGFLEEELEHLNRVVWSGLRTAIAQGDQTTIRRVREVVETCQTQVREVIAGAAATGEIPNDNEQ